MKIKDAHVERRIANDERFLAVSVILKSLRLILLHDNNLKNYNFRVFMQSLTRFSSHVLRSEMIKGEI